MRGSTALVIGEVLIDIVEHVDGSVPREEHIGGSPANVAMGLARLRHPVCLAAHAGTDARGHRIKDYLSAEGVEFDDGSFNAERTSTALATIDTAGTAHYVFDIAWRVPAGLTARVSDGVGTGAPALVHVGSIALFLEPGGTDVASIVDKLPTSTMVTVDPNIRPALLPDHAAALSRFERVAARANLVKLSDEDSAWLYPHLPLAAAAEHILSLGGTEPAGIPGPRIVVTTLGAAGASAIASPGAPFGVTRYTVSAASAEVVDTISAGDSFMAALASSLLDLGIEGVHLRLQLVLERAARAAGIAVSAAGANPPHRAELESAG